MKSSFKPAFQDTSVSWAWEQDVVESLYVYTRFGTSIKARSGRWRIWRW